MRATETTKKAAFDAGYQLFVSTGDYMAARTSKCPFHIPAEAWAWVRGFEQACSDARARKDDMASNKIEIRRDSTEAWFLLCYAGTLSEAMRVWNQQRSRGQHVRITNSETGFLVQED